MIAPLLMTLILTRGTGQRLTDRRMAATSPRYADYAARTSGFIPPPAQALLGVVGQVGPQPPFGLGHRDAPRPA